MPPRSSSSSSPVSFSEVYVRRRDDAYMNAMDPEQVDVKKWKALDKLYGKLDKRLFKKGDRKWQSLNQAAKTSKLQLEKNEYILTLVYYGLLFSDDSDCIYRNNQRIRALIYNPSLTDLGLEKVATIARCFSPSISIGSSHHDFLKLCVSNMNNWFMNPKLFIHQNMTFAMLKDELSDIAKAPFHNSKIAEFPLCDGDVVKDECVRVHGMRGRGCWNSLNGGFIALNYSLTYKLALKSQGRTSNQKGGSRIFIGLDEYIGDSGNGIENAVQIVGLEDGNDVTVHRLSATCRFIIREIIKQLKNLYNDNACYKGLCIRDIRLQVDDERQIYSVKLRRLDDASMSKLATYSRRKLRNTFVDLKKIIIEDFVVVPEEQRPPDFKHFLADLQNPSKNYLEIWNHSCLWEPVDVVKNVLVFNMLARSNSMAIIPDQTTVDCHLNELGNKITHWSKYKTMYDAEMVRRKRWYYTLQGYACFVLSYMKNVFTHWHNDNQRQCILKTEGDLYCILPEFFALFVRETANDTVTEGIYAS